jgi:hypothetical protein
MYHLKNQAREKSMSHDDRKVSASEHHNTSLENYDAASQDIAKDIAQRRTSNQIQ